MQRQERPNVIVFFTDQQRADTMGLHGNPLDLTPNLDRMARQGTHLQHTYTCQPVCGPARAVLQTGTYPTVNGCFRNGIPLQRDADTLARRFSSAGYDTAYIGKWHLAGEDPVPRAEQGGYDYWLGANVLEFCSEPYHTVMYDGDGNARQLPGYRVDALTDAAVQYIHGRDGANPFFLFLSFLEPHHQNHLDDYPPPEGYRERYTGRYIPPDLAALPGSAHRHLGGYYGMVKRLDEALGRLMDGLKSMGMDEDTIVLFTSDHGCHFKTRNGEYKRSGHDSSIRIPGALWGPGFNGGGEVNELVSLIDLPPTLLDAAGISIPGEMQGRSLLPLLRNPATPWPDDLFVQISESQVGRAVRTKRWKYGVAAPHRNGRDHPDSDSYQEEYLYDLAADPHELNNLIGKASHRRVSEVMRQRLLQRMEEAGESAPAIEPAPEQPGGQFSVSEREAQE